MLDFARNAITEFVADGKIIPTPEKYPQELHDKKGVFVSLHTGSILRGCVGFLARRSILENLRDAAVEVCKDSRFFPVCENELKCLTMEVSLLSNAKIINAGSSEDLLEKINAGRDGLIIEKDGRSGLFLPQVWKDIPDKKDFLCHLCGKASLPEDAWTNGAKICKFGAEVIEGNFMALQKSGYGMIKNKRFCMKFI